MSGALLHSPAKLTLEVLINEGLGFRVQEPNVDWMCFLNKGVPEKEVSTSDFTVDKIISVYDTSAIVDTNRIQNSGLFHEAHGVQIALRLNEYEEAVGYAKARAIQDHLDTSVYRLSLNVGGTDYLVHSYSRSTDIIRVNNVIKDDHAYGLKFTLNLLMYVTRA